MTTAPWILGISASHDGAACLLHGHDLVVARGDVDRPAGAAQLAADLHDPGHADGGGLGEQLLDRHRLLAPAGEVHVAVVVDDRVRQRLGSRRPLVRIAHPRTRSRIASASSSGAWVGIQWLTTGSSTKR